MGFDRKLQDVHTIDEGVVACPFSFISRAASVPDTIKGAIISSSGGVKSLVRTSAGLFTFTATDKPYEVVGGSVICTSGAAEDIVPHLDASAMTSTGVVTIRTMTGTTPTDPATGCTFYGVLFCRTTDRGTGL